MSERTTEQLNEAWTFLLNLWHTRGLPTPLRISLSTDTIVLPANERGQVDTWVAALGCEPATIQDAVTTNQAASYWAAPTREAGVPQYWVMCELDLTADAEAHGYAPPSPLAAAAAAVVHMVGA